MVLVLVLQLKSHFRPEIAKAEARILASVADAVKSEKDQLDEIKSRLVAIE